MASYPWPSTVNIANYVSMKPRLKQKERSNSYEIWKEQMLCLLEGQDLLGFIDGQIPQPSALERSMDEQRHWRRTDKLIKGWILGSIGEDTVAAVWTLSSSRDVWLELERLFDRSNQDNSKTQKPISLKEVFEEEVAAGVGGGIENVSSELVSPTSNSAAQEDNGAGKDCSMYLPLCRAITGGDWKEVDKILEGNEEASTAVITEIEETALLVAVGTGRRANDLVRKLLIKMPKEALVRRNTFGNTALHRAAMIGNKEAAIMLVDSHPELLYIPNNSNNLPVHEAAIYCHKETLEYLISVSTTTDAQKSPFVGQLGASLLWAVITSQFIDVALNLVKAHPELASLKNHHDTYALHEVARSASVFRSGTKFCMWNNWIYSRIVLTSTEENSIDDIENLCPKDGVTKKLRWFEILYRIPQVKSIKDKKLMHQQALELVKCLCRGLESLPSSVALPIYKSALFLAAHNGINEVVEVIVDIFPTVIHFSDAETGSNIFHIAARERFENVFNLFHQMAERKQLFFDVCDTSGNNYMHVCGDQAPPHNLNLVSGAALQMQRELQWFKEMEKFVTPSRRTWRNKAGRTPQMLFTEKHQELKSQGEKWMKDTATSCTIAAALIATVVFAAAFTVPGSVNNDNGRPFFLDNPWFIVFAISDSVSLFTSTTSLLMFLSILTSRYAEEDFLYVLPKRLCIGLLTLFTSITFMMVAFNTAIYLTLKDKSRLFIIPVVALACFPVASFMFLQFPLLIAVMYSTYGRGIFGKKK